MGEMKAGRRFPVSVGTSLPNRRIPGRSFDRVMRLRRPQKFEMFPVPDIA
jgi:hypothetical protein